MKNSPAIIKTMNPLMAKLKDSSGFMLGEQLLSIIFIGLLCIAISAGIGVALAAFANISDQANANQLLSRSILEINDELAYSLEVQNDQTSGQSNSFISATNHTYVYLLNDTAANGISMYGENLAGAGSDTVTLIPAAGNLSAYFSELPVYDKTSNTWQYTLQIKKGNTVLKEQEMTVARIMSSET